MRDLVGVHFPDVPRITLVVDNLNTHVSASLYKAPAPSSAWSTSLARRRRTARS
jgi:hypothetical protein